MKVIRFLTTLLASLLFSTAVFAGVPSEDGKKDEGKQGKCLSLWLGERKSR